MAWTAPATAVTGDIVPASFWNTYGRDNLSYLKGLLDGTGGAITVTVPDRLQVANDANFSLYKAGSSPLLLFDTNDYCIYDRGTNTLSFVVGGATRALFDSAGKITSVGPMNPANDATFSLYMLGGGPIVLFDTNDYLYYDRASNYWQFVIGGLQKLVIDANGKFTGVAFYDSGAVTVASGATVTMSHGLPAQPRFFTGSQNNGSGVPRYPVAGYGVGGAVCAWVAVDSSSLQIVNNTGASRDVRAIAML